MYPHGAQEPSLECSDLCQLSEKQNILLQVAYKHNSSSNT